MFVFIAVMNKVLILYDILPSSVCLSSAIRHFLNCSSTV